MPVAKKRPRHRRSIHNMTRDEYLGNGARLYAKQGADLPQAKLTAATVALIRRQHDRKLRLIAKLNETYSAAAMAARHGVHVRTIEKALRRESWASAR